MLARYNYRIYLNPIQINQLAKFFGCCRVVHNDALSLYKERGFFLGAAKKVITEAKKTEQRAWLSEAPRAALNFAIQNIEKSYRQFFNSLKGKRKGKRLGSPKFKSKHSRQSLTMASNGFRFKNGQLYLAKLGKVKTIWSRPLPSVPSSVTIIKDCTNRYYASFVVEVDQLSVAAPNESVGIDLGLTHFAILSDGEKIENPRLQKKRLNKIKRFNQKLSRKQKGSKRRQLAKLNLAKIHAKIKDARTDFLHKLTTRLVRENQALAVEDLNVSGMVKNRKLSRAISDAGWYSFRQLLSAKCDKYDRQLVVINRWEATSQKCSSCGFQGGKKEL